MPVTRVAVVVRVAPHIAHEFGGDAAVGAQVPGIALDPAVREMDAEHRGVAVQSGAHVLRSRPVLDIDDALASAGVPVLEGETIRVEERDAIAGIAARPAGADVAPAEQDQRVEFLDGGQTPIAIAAQVQGWPRRSGPRRRSAWGRGPAAT